MYMNIVDVLNNTNWKLLAEQKLGLIRLMGDSHELDGLLAWIDCIQDAAQAQSYPVVFLTEDENE